jgi:hypothetical protein
MRQSCSTLAFEKRERGNLQFNDIIILGFSYCWILAPTKLEKTLNFIMDDIYMSHIPQTLAEKLTSKSL